MTQINNCTTLRNDLLSAYEQLRSGDMKEERARELANIAGKVLKSAQVQVSYYELRKEVPQIDFLKDDRTGEEAE